MTRPLGVYVHVPYCAVRCAYCDFNTYTFAAGRSSFAATAAREVALAGASVDRPVSTVFFGGGTPTLLDPSELARVLRAIEDELGLERDAEVTVEANPDSVDAAALAELRAAGFTRVSLGMQSGAEHVLRFLGRTHAPGRPVAAAVEARDAGFEHVSLDLIYGSPGESDDDWRATVEAAVEAGPDHVSAYNLTVEPGTRLHADVRRGSVPAPAEEALADRYAIAEETLTAAGLEWYEVASWARTDEARCRHNEGYWTGADWLAIGPGAHGHLDGRRWWNVKHPTAWAARVEAGEAPVDGEEILTAEQRRLERIMLELRRREGVDRGLASPEAAEQLVADGLLRRDADRLVLTLRGRQVADLVTRTLAGR
jgi:putative oxygen-independent coproporphyrinogen III oxidase